MTFKYDKKVVKRILIYGALCSFLTWILIYPSLVEINIDYLYEYTWWLIFPIFITGVFCLGNLSELFVRDKPSKPHKKPSEGYILFTRILVLLLKLK